MPTARVTPVLMRCTATHRLPHKKNVPGLDTYGMQCSTWQVRGRTYRRWVFLLEGLHAN